MANYDVGTLMLDLQIAGEQDLDSRLTRIEQGLEDADAAGQSFYRNNRRGFDELRTLTARAGEGVGKLADSYDAGELSAQEYADALELVNRINTLAARSGTTLRRSLVDVQSTLERLSGLKMPKFDWDAANVEDYNDELKRSAELHEAAEDQIESRIRAERLLGDTIEETNKKAAQAPERRSDADANPFSGDEVDYSGYQPPIEETERYADTQRELEAQVRETTEALREQSQVGRTTPPAPPAPPRNPPAGGGGGGDDDRNRKAPVVEISAESLAKLKEYENRLTIIDGMHRAGQTPTKQFRIQLDELGDEALESAKKMDRLSDEYAKYIGVAGRAGGIKTRLDDATLKESYFSKQFILGNALSNMYGEWGIRITDSVFQGIGAMDDMSLATEKAKDGQLQLLQAAQDSGTSYAQVRADVDATAAKYMVLATNAEGAAAKLLEAGYSSEQVAQLLDAVGATAIQGGQDVREAFAAIAAGGSDVEGALTTATGATGAFDQALLRAAGGQSAMVERLTAAQRQAALLSSVLDSASSALNDYGQNTDGIVGAQMRQTAAVELFRREMGEQFAPTVERAIQLGTDFIQMTVRMIAPVAAAADGVARLADNFNSFEVMLLAIAVGGPRAVVVIGQLAAWMPKLAAGARLVMAAFGGWPGLLATVAAATFGLLVNTDTAVQRLEKSLDKVKDASATAGTAFDTLKKATDDEGLKGAVTALASTMDTEASQAFTDFAEDAIESAETTMGAIDAIYAYLAQNRKDAIEGALADLEPVIAQLQDRQGGNEAFDDAGGGERLAALEQERAGLQALRDEILSLPPLEALDRQMELTDAQNQLAYIDQQMTALATARAGLGGVDNEQAAKDQQQLNELLARRKKLTQELNVLEATPRQAVDRYFNKGKESGENNPLDGPPVDPFEDARDSLNVARAAYNALKTEMDLGDAGFGDVNAGAQSLLGTMDVLLGKMQALNGTGQLAADQQVELYNLAGERARLVAEINESPNVEREQNAGTWIERLTTDVERGKTRAVDAMGALTQAQANLKEEMKEFSGPDPLTPEQEAKFAMLQRLMGLVETGIVDFEARVAEFNQADMFGGLKASIQDYIGEQERIPERVLTKFEAAGGDRSAYDEYNEKFEQLDASQRDLLTIQGDLANAPLLMARNQALAGTAVDDTANRAEALRIALAAAYGLNPDTAGLQTLLALWEQQLAVVDAAVVREGNLSASAAEVVAQRQAAASALSQADAAAKAAAVSGGNAMAQQQARVDSLRNSLVAVGENSISGQKIAKYYALGLLLILLEDHGCRYEPAQLVDQMEPPQRYKLDRLK